MSWTLGIETSTRSGSIALSSGGEVAVLRTLGTVSQRHAQTLFVEIDDAVKELGLTPQDLSRIAVSIGPGSFTGLRIGVVAAKTLAWSLQCELKPIDSFLAVAARLSGEIGSAWVIGDAQRGDLFTGRYAPGSHGVWKQTHPIEIQPSAKFLSHLAATDFVTGTAVDRYEPQLLSACRVASPDLREPRADAVCLLAERDDLPAVDPWSLEPFYLRKSTAEEKWEARNPSV